MLPDEASLPFFSLIGLICSFDFHNKLVTSFTPVILLILRCSRNDMRLGATVLNFVCQKISDMAEITEFREISAEIHF